MRKIFTPLLLLLLVGATAGISAQKSAQPALKYLQDHPAEFGVTAADVADLRVTDNYLSPSGAQHVYVRQLVHGLPVFNAQAALHFRGEKLAYRTSALAPSLADVPAPAPALSAQTAVGKAAEAVTAAFGNPVANGREDDAQLFAWPSLTAENIRVTTGYFATKGGLRHAYRITIDQHAAHSDYWLVYVDANDGRILDADNLVLKCDFGAPNHQHDYDNACANKTAADLPASERLIEKTFTTNAVVEESSYLVFPFGEESPLHGDRVLEVSPAHPVASPFGWHDTDGEEGAEFTYTRGNNVYSYPDRNADDSPDEERADGGDSLQFEFFFEENVDASDILQAAMTQTFYYTNKLHDWLYVHGFDEQAGNFQRNNYTDLGEDRDPVNVEVQDGSGTNNANFGTPPDGASGTMQMFLWVNDNSAMRIEGGSAAGRYATVPALFGTPIGVTPVAGKLAIAQDASADPFLVCEEVANTDEVEGKIVMVNRGECFFEQKVDNAEEAGAIGVIVCNAGAAIGGMAESTDPDEFLVDIPSVLIPESECVRLRAALVADGDVNVVFQIDPPVDGDFDNGIVAHELGHGVSTRLVGGPNRADCLRNDEQMGEGWSDFFTLAASPQTIIDNPDGTERRGIGNYATRREIDGGGIRRLPYSTDMAVNDYTYDAIIYSGTAPHPLGEIWATTLWDLYWAMVDEHGFDDDLIDGTGGNNLAVQLVVEGLKYTKCNPGMVDGRDGILIADEIVNNSANQCLIWDVFARRGLGFSAKQGDTDSRTDGFEAFDVSPYCIGGVQMEKTVDATTVTAGEGVTYSLKAISYRPAETENVVITDNIPAGMTIDPASVRGSEDFTIAGNTITFRLGTLEFEEEQTVRYSVTTDPDRFSVEAFFDGAESEDEIFEIVDETVIDPANLPPFDAFWEQSDTTPYAGDLAYYVVNTGFTQTQAIELTDPVDLTQGTSLLRFFTQYDTEPAWDAGIVEVSTDRNNWERVDDKFVRGGYRGEIAPTGTAELQNTTSFWGASDGYREIIADLSDYAGQSVYLRYVFYADQSVSGRGWWVDNIQILNEAVNYEAEAVLTSDAGDNYTAAVGEFGVLVVGDVLDNTVDPALGETSVEVFPNPAADFVTVNISAERAGDATVQLLSVDGRVLHRESLRLVGGGGQTTINTAQLPAGLYLVQVAGASQVSTTKVTIN